MTGNLYCVLKQDWIALVKAASAASKSKGVCKPRTSASSNRDREDRTELKFDDLEDEEEEEDDADSDRLGSNGVLLSSRCFSHWIYIFMY